MPRRLLSTLAAIIAAGASAAVSAAALSVVFVDPDRFTDAAYSHPHGTAQERAEVLRDIERHLRQLAERRGLAVQALEGGHHVAQVAHRDQHFHAVAPAVLRRGQQQDVVRLAVPMDHPHLVRPREARGSRACEWGLGRFGGDAAVVQEQMMAMNEALVLGSLRQHELTGAADALNAQLRREMAERSALELKAQEQAAKLAELDRQKDEFLAMLSHELRSPLATLRAGIEIAAADPTGAMSPQRIARSRIGVYLGAFIPQRAAIPCAAPHDPIPDSCFWYSPRTASLRETSRTAPPHAIIS